MTGFAGLLGCDTVLLVKFFSIFVGLWCPFIVKQPKKDFLDGLSMKIKALQFILTLAVSHATSESDFGQSTGKISP
jgi:hypothetical protein